MTPATPHRSSAAIFDSEVDYSLLEKYNVSGPRYTSYPTAPQFSDTFKSQDLREEVRRLNAGGEATPLSLYFHLPFCESVCFFCGCNVTFTADRKRPGPYTEKLIREMDALVPLIDQKRKVEQLHWGGGTPTFFGPDQLRLLHEATLERFNFHPDAEVGLEVDPRETTSEHLKTLGSLGFNRLSMGVQDFDPAVQKAVNRLQPEEMTRKVIEEARELGFRSISVDLIYGLPHQSEAGFSKTLERVIALNPDRVAVFNFAYLPEMIRHQKAIKADELPAPKVKLAILKRCVEMFAQAGYRNVGMDHFARPEDELCRAQDAGTLYRNFQGYTTHAGCDLHAFGVSAISQVGSVYSQNTKNIHEYEKAVTSDGLAVQRGIRLSAEDELRREVIMRLLCDFSLNFKRMGEKHRIDFAKHFEASLDALQPMTRDGLVKLDQNGLTVTPTGRMLIRNVCMVFDQYLAAKSGAKFSKTV
jgi:oxygen-independent coproporphyrinogen III oxidase